MIKDFWVSHSLRLPPYFFSGLTKIVHSFRKYSSYVFNNIFLSMVEFIKVYKIYFSSTKAFKALTFIPTKNYTISLNICYFLSIKSDLQRSYLLYNWCRIHCIYIKAINYYSYAWRLISLESYTENLFYLIFLNFFLCIP